MTVRTRIAPSPTGELHIGVLRTLLYCYALARQNNGQFILRIEDTDQKRLVPGSDLRLMETVRAYGLDWDEGPDKGGDFGPYIQTQRLPLYQKHIQQLIDTGHAYYCFCTEDRLAEMRQIQKNAHQISRYDRHCLSLTPEEVKQKLASHTPYVIRLRVPDSETVIVHDEIRGDIKFNSREIDDQVLIKSNGIPTYHFAVVVDDHLMNITHIFRGEEWITSTPKQVLLYRFFGWEIPKIIHLTVLLDPSHSGKMSKRRGKVFAQQYLDDGYLPEAMLNFLMLLGWNPGDNREIFSLDDFVKEFSLEKLHKKSPIFDRKKLDYLNGYYLRQKTNAELVEALKPFLPQATSDQLQLIVPLIKERITKLSDATALLSFVFEDKTPLLVDLANNGKIAPAVAIDMLTQALDILNTYQKFDQTPELQEKLINLIKTNNWKTGDFFMTFRVAITGSRFTPPIVESLVLLSKNTVMTRLRSAITLLS